MPPHRCPPLPTVTAAGPRPARAFWASTNRIAAYDHSENGNISNLHFQPPAFAYTSADNHDPRASYAENSILAESCCQRTSYGERGVEIGPAQANDLGRQMGGRIAGVEVFSEDGTALPALTAARGGGDSLAPSRIKTEDVSAGGSPILIFL